MAVKMVASPVIHVGEQALENALSSAPPDEWGTILGNMLGTACRAVEGNHSSREGSEGGFTVTSLLGMMSQEEPVAAHSAESRGAGAPSVQSRLRKAGRARQKEARPAEQPKEDDRPLEDLLKNLGVKPDDVAGGQKGKKKAPKLASPPKRPEVPEKGAAVQQTLEPKKAEEESVQQLNASGVAESTDDDESWQTVPSKPARRAPGLATVEKTKGADSSKKVLPEAMSPQVHSQARKCPAAKAKASLPASQSRPLERVAADANRGKPWTEGAASGAMQTGEPSAESRAGGAGADTQAVTAMSAWHCRPSVGTWYHSSSPISSQAPGQRRRRRSLSEGADPIGKSSTDSDLEEVEVQDHRAEASSSASPSGRTWSLQPSVGTWLNTPRAQKAQEEDLQLWPPTPETTPPASPRRGSGTAFAGSDQVLWMPIPLHLVGEVQQLINTRLQQGSPGC